MKKFLLISVISLFVIFGVAVLRHNRNTPEYGAPPYTEDDDPILPRLEWFPDILNWQRPDGPLRVGLQVGHWKNQELPDELERIRGNGGAKSRGVENEGVIVDILPATVPPSYWADSFIAIHADGSESASTNGYKVSAPRRDYTNKAGDLVKIIEEEYEKGVGFPKDTNVTRNMRGYYAFSWWKYVHAVHPMTPSVILETGFLTNPKEAALLINHPEIPAQALAKAILSFLRPG